MNGMTPSCSEWQVLGERPGDCWVLNPSGFSTYLFGKRVFKDVGLLLNLGLIKDRDGQRDYLLLCLGRTRLT